LKFTTINNSHFILKFQQNPELLQKKRTVLKHSDFDFNVYDKMKFNFKRKMKNKRQ